MKETIAVIGEGITEEYYLLSLKDIYKEITLSPKLPKHSTSMNDMKKRIEECIDKGYSKVFCLIDMDNKKDFKNKSAYLELKDRYHNKDIKKKKKGISCHVRFFETNRCTELFFYYYFQYTSRCFYDSNEVVEMLKCKCAYEKTDKFFRLHPLHQYFESKGGLLKSAIDYADKSMKEKILNDTETYSELGAFFKELDLINNEK